MKLLLSLSALFFVVALITQFRHEIEMSTDGLSDVGRESKYSLHKFAYEHVSNTPYPGAETYHGDLLQKKAKDQPLVFFLYGAGILFLFGGIMKSKDGTNIPDSRLSK